MAWRIHFTPDDLERTQVGLTLGPLAETVMAVALLRCPQQRRALLGEWRGQVQGRITPRMRPLTALIPPGVGLIASRRQGGAVLHVLTPLGAELLQAG